MIRIIHIGKPLAGVGVHIKLIVKHLDGAKFSNEIILNKNDKNIDLNNAHGHAIKAHHAQLIRSINLKTDIKAFFQIVKILRSRKPDVIHCHSAKAGIIGRLAGFVLGIKTFYTPNAYSYLSAEGRKRKLFKIIERFFGTLPSFTIACSQSEYDRAIKDLSIKPSKVFLWNNCIEDIDKPSSNEHLLELPKAYICSIGRPSYQKNTLLLVKAIENAKNTLPNLYVVILGVGFYSPELERIKAYIEKNDLSNHISLVPWVEREATLDVLKKSLFYISTSRYEGLPYAAIEALALHKSCVLTNVDGNKDLLENNVNGYLTEENPIEIASRIVDLVKDEGLRKKMNANARKRFEDLYQIKKNISLLEALYLHTKN